ncbi:MAG TPA: LIC_13355 family lipoprotein [Turneriella sp.]|nr:LIC_13355 family lipoprotein [Turneriella sp.]
MKIQQIALVFMATLIAHCAQINKEKIAGETPATTSPNSGDGGTSPFNAQLATGVVDAPCNGHATDGCQPSFSDPIKATNGVKGAGWGSGSFDVYSMSESTADGGKYATLTLDWQGATVKNVQGVDFVVYENAFEDLGTYGTRFMDLIVVSVSQNNTDYCGWPVEYKGKKGNDSLADFQNGSLTEDKTLYSKWPEAWVHFAGKSPTAWNQDTAPMSYDDLFTTKTTEYFNGQTLMYSRTDLKGGGDGFDLDALVTNASCSAAVRDAIQADGFKYIKLQAAHSLINPDTGSLYPHEAISNGPDVDGILARHVVP